MSEQLNQNEVVEPLRDQIGRAIYQDPRANDDWYSLSEERREPWRRDADRVIALLESKGILTAALAEEEQDK